MSEPREATGRGDARVRTVRGDRERLTAGGDRERAAEGDRERRPGNATARGTAGGDSGEAAAGWTSDRIRRVYIRFYDSRERAGESLAPEARGGPEMGRQDEGRPPGGTG
ncbi:unnamed protein product [Arctogadus glacialis]